MSPSRQLQKVYLAGFLFNVSYLLFAVLIPLDALSLHLAIWTVGVLTALPGVLQLPTRIISGPLVDWLGERWVLWLTFALEVLAGLCVLAGHGAPIATLIAGQLLIGAARGFFWTAAQSEVSRQPGNRPQHLGLFTSYTKGGALIGIAGAGAAATFLGLSGGFMVSAALAALALAIGCTLTPASRSRRQKSFCHAVQKLVPASRQPFVVVNGLIALLCAVPQALAQSFYPVVLIRLGLSQAGASLETSLMGLGMIVAGIVGAQALRMLGMRRLIALGTVLVALSLAGTAYHHIALDGVTIFLGGLAAGWLNVGFLTAVSSRSRDGDRGTNLAVTQVYFVVAIMATPLISGWLLSRFGIAITFLVEAGLALLAVALVMILWRWQDHAQRPVGVRGTKSSGSIG